MKLTNQDIDLFAARNRPHFEPELRDIAYELALDIARTAGVKAKQLRSETSIREILMWHQQTTPIVIDGSLDEFESIMSFEAEMRFSIPETMAADLDRATFRDLVLHRARQRRAA